MPVFVSLLDWTDQGVGNFKDTLDRAEAAKDAAKQLNGSLEVTGRSANTTSSPSRSFRTMSQPRRSC
jgi:hypothetical protein